MKRREMIIGSGAAITAATITSFIPGARTVHAGRPLGAVHISAAEQAKKLANGRKISLKILLPGGSSANVKPVADAFEQSTGIIIELVEAPVDEINSQIVIDNISGANSFDLALPATFGVPDLVSAGVLVNLDEFAKKYEPQGFQDDALFSLGDYYKGNLYGYQTDGDAYLMFYKKDCIENPEEKSRFADLHGYPLAIPRTWEELDAQMAFFHRPDDNLFGGALYRSSYYIAWEFWCRFHAKGYYPFDTNLVPQINNPSGIEALEQLISANKSLYPKARTNGLFDNWKAFANGNIYCNIGWGGTQKYLNRNTSKVKGNLLFGPTPGGIINGVLTEMPYFNWGWNYIVSIGSTQKELAYLFSLYACSPKMSTLAVREGDGFFDPFRSTHYDDPEIQNTYTTEFLDVHRTSMSKSIPDLYLSGQGEYFDALRQNLARADQGEIKAARALDLTAQQWEQTTRQLGRASQVEQWLYLRASYPDTVRRAMIN